MFFWVPNRFRIHTSFSSWSFSYDFFFSDHFKSLKEPSISWCCAFDLSDIKEFWSRRFSTSLNVFEFFYLQLELREKVSTNRPQQCPTDFSPKYLARKTSHAARNNGIWDNGLRFAKAKDWCQVKILVSFRTLFYFCNLVPNIWSKSLTTKHTSYLHRKSTLVSKFAERSLTRKIRE